MREQVTPKVDIAFKKLFGVEENKDLLISLINSIVTEEDQVEEVDLLNPYNAQNFKDDKGTILDIKAKGKTGKRYNIEMQINDEANYDKRALHYWAELYTEQLKSGDGFSMLNKTIGIHILNFTSISSIKEYHNRFILCDEKSKTHHFKDIELHTIELSKFENHRKDQNPNEAEEIKLLLSKMKTSLDRWVAFLTRHDLLKKVPKELNDPKIQKAIEVLDVMNFTEQEIDAYKGRLHWLRLEASALEKRFGEGRAEGRTEGLIEGRVEGVQIGEQRGIEKGRTEGRSEGRTEIIEKMLSQGVNVTVIANFTGSTVKEIEEIKSKLEIRSGVVECV